ncbi:protein translocase subunit SecD [Glutamicibacter protophormiae]|uniref:protein translocase subunit SecD n=1 Tax=Glutamicibacter protophormiae TaxID=37930 RepID=UPI002A7EDFBC|nr:protein translocase subunit SecD [Glutamicibacter protophormiae]WPR63068.1 protein translocase subunit SecD [Glutamicibacter protophormiae]WPR66565.1 protein translocase subunit SecD [Glutamicibacter protophormiae]
MSSIRPVKQARKALLWLLVVFLIASGVLVGGVLSGKTSFAPKLALDLEGGTQMILAPRVQGDQAISQEQLDQAVEIIRQRVDGAGVTESEITTQSGRNVVVSMPGVPTQETRDLIQASANMEFRPVLITGAYTATPEADLTPAKDLPKPTGKPENPSDTNWITPELYKQFEAYDCPTELKESSTTTHDPAKPMISCDERMGVKYILGPQEIPGDQISDAYAQLARGVNGSVTGEWVVVIEFNSEGTKTFADTTQRLISLTGSRNQFAIVLDGNTISAPTTNAVISDGRPQISGGFTQETSQALAEQLKYGALPISFDIQSEQQVSATLGADQLKAGLIAGIIGLIAVFIYSIFQYRALGFVTIASLLASGVLTYLALVLLGWGMNYRLSLAGVAGLIVAIGLIADSFIVYFERVRDELRDGRPLASAVAVGWKRAERTILASKAVNVLAAVVLYIVAVGNVRGFAFTLGLTAVIDLVVVYGMTHPTLVLLARTKFFAEGHRFSGLDPSLLGAEPLYKGAGQIRRFTDNVEANRGKKNQKAGVEAAKRMTIAERRRAEANSAPARAKTAKDKAQEENNE